MHINRRRCTAALTVFFLQCAGFRIQELAPSVLVQIPVSLPEDHRTSSIQATFNGRIATNFPYRPYPGPDQVFLQDAHNARVLGFKYSGDLDFLIQKKKPNDYRGTYINFDPGIPGLITGHESTLYIESMLPQPIKDTRPTYWIPGSSAVDAPADQRLPGSMAGKERGTSLSRIVQIEGGRIRPETKGKEIRFEQIFHMQAGSGGKLYVFHEISDKKDRKRILSVFENGTWILDVGFENWTAEENRNYVIQIEAIAPAGPSYLLTAVFRNKSSYEPVFRRVYRLHENGSHEVVVEEKDPRIFFFSAGEDGSFWLMEPAEDNSRILLRFFTATGEYQSNRLIEFPGLRASWRETYSIGGRLFTSRLYRGFFELHEWK